MALHFDKISATRLLSLSRETTVFFFATGALEDHGPHLPLGLATLHASKQVELCAERLESEKPGWTAVIMPAMPLSIDSHTTSLGLTVRAMSYGTGWSISARV